MIRARFLYREFFEYFPHPQDLAGYESLDSNGELFSGHINKVGGLSSQYWCGMNLVLDNLAYGLLHFSCYITRRNKMKGILKRLWQEEEGQDLVEYGLLLVLVSLGAVAAMGTLASAISGAFGSASSNLGSS